MPARQSVRRHNLPARADRAAIYRILDAGWIAHVGFSVRARPLVIPMLYARSGDSLLLNGNLDSRLIGALHGGAQACVSVALVDGLVLARSHLHHSMNYRSVAAFGRALPIEDPAEKVAALACLVDTLVPGRANEARPADPRELGATALLRFSIDEATARIRSGPPVDALSDLDLPYWAGELPMRPGYDLACPSPDLAPDLPLPNSLRRLLAAGIAQSA